MARRNAKRVDERYGVLRDISSNWSPTKAARLLAEFVDQVTLEAGAYYGSDTTPRGESRVPFQRISAGGLRRVPLYVVSPDMGAVVSAAAMTLSPEDLSDPSVFSEGGGGVLLFPKEVPTLLGSFTGSPQAISWEVSPRGGKRPELYLVAYKSTSSEMREVGPFEHPEGWPRGGKNALIYHATYTLDDEPYEPPEDALGVVGRQILSHVFAFLRLAEQRTTAETVERVPADPGTPKRAPRPEQDVRVTYLRRSSSGTPSGESRKVDWNSRWVVSMHKARQWYPKEQKHKIIFRGPYIKGPADKPIRTTPNVRALVR